MPSIPDRRTPERRIADDVLDRMRRADLWWTVGWSSYFAETFRRIVAEAVAEHLRAEHLRDEQEAA